PGLASHSQHQLAQQQMSRYSSLFGFTLATEDLDAIKAFFNSLKLFGRGVSWGGHESLIFAPAISALKEQSPERFAAMGLSLSDMRVSVGLEHAEDLIADLSQALEKI
ncbi:MAG: cystathionine gamma-lyase, partial [Proteobacteria bacterium]|nr:cystathionine gamma-lyase [Pseudomonadota bacterium]